MSDELLSILKYARRKLLAVRAAESACAMVAVGAVLAAAGELAWAAASWRAWAGIAIAASCAAASCLLPFLPRVGAGRRKTPVSRWLMAGTGLLVAGFVGWGILAGFCLRLPKFALAGAVLLAAVLVGAGAALARGAGLRQVAAMLDAKAGLRERLSTAVELAFSPAPAPASAPVVREQALAALRLRRPQDMPMWSASPALPAAMALALAMCLALAFLPDFGAASQAARIEQFSRSLGDMTPDQRQQLAAALRQAAAGGKVSPEVARELASAAAAVVEANDAEELRKLFQRLQDEGVDPLGVVPHDLLVAAGLAGKTPATIAAGNHSGTARNTAATGEANDLQKMARGYMSVFDPRSSQYARGGETDANDRRAAPGPAVPFADAWSAARARALDNAQRGAVPAAYRRLVHDFFAGQE